MSRQRQDQLLSTLLRQGDWATAASLADQLGVTPRSIRSYVAAVNARTGDADAVESGPAGYRAGAGARRALRTRQSGESAPRDRLHGLVRTLLDVPTGVDVFEAANELHVSEATLEADLSRVRGLLEGTELTLERDREIVRLRGTEAAQRRLLSRLAHDEMDAASFHPETFRRALEGGAVAAGSVAPFKSALVGELGELGYYVNELAISDVLLHIAIAAERVAAGHALEAGPTGAREEIPRVGAVIARLAHEHFSVTLGDGDSSHLASLVLTRIVAPGEDAAGDVARSGVDPAVETAVRAEIARAAEDFQVDLVDETFVLRLALHVQNLMRRAQERALTRNPLTRSLKTSYPMIFEVAVSIASGLHDRLGTPIHDDEIAYVAMHVGDGSSAAARRSRSSRRRSSVPDTTSSTNCCDRASTGRWARRSRSPASSRTSIPTGRPSTPTWCSAPSSPAWSAIGSCASSPSSPTPTWIASSRPRPGCAGGDG